MWFILLLIGLFVVYVLLNFWLEKRHTEYGITFIAGQIGAGKSTFAVKQAIKHLKAGWNVYSTDYIEGCFQLNVKDLETMSCPEKSLLIIDEASLKMNAREFAKTKLSLIEYFKLSRHYKNKVIMISQTFGDTDKQIRELASKVFFIRKFLNGVISFPVRVHGDLAIGQDGQPAVQYRIGHLAAPLYLPRWYKYFNSFDDVSRPLITGRPWSNLSEVVVVENKEKKLQKKFGA